MPIEDINLINVAKADELAQEILDREAHESRTDNPHSVTAAQIGVASGATANSTDAQLRDRATHTGTQNVSTITGLGDAATKNTGTTVGAVAAGDDGRFTNLMAKIVVPQSNYADNATYHYGCYDLLPISVSGITVTAKGIYFNRSVTIRRVVIKAVNLTTNATSEDSIFYLRINDTTDYLITNAMKFNVGNAGNNADVVLATPVTLPNPTDFFTIKHVCPTWVTNPAGTILIIYIYE